MDIGLYESFLSLVKLGIGRSKDAKISKDIDWVQMKALADEQGLSAVILDGIDKCHTDITDFEAPTNTMPLEFKLEWIGEVLQDYEGRYAEYKKAIGSLAGIYHRHGLKMMVLKGYACSLDWPKPEHRPCGDIDIWQFGRQKEADEVLLTTDFTDYTDKEANTNDSNLTNKIEIDTSQHHHTVFEWKGFTVENHYDFINVNHHPSHRGLEAIFKELGDVSNVKDNLDFGSNTNGTNITNVVVNGEKVYVPSPNLHALFLLRHALNHFASIGINLRNVLDWAFFVERHTKEIDWEWLQSVMDEYHMRDFYNCINAICVEYLGFNPTIFPSVQCLPIIKEKVLNDILNPEFTIGEPDGFCRKWMHKYRRWRGNRWKQELCYKENTWSAFWSGLMVHLAKPKTN